MGQCRLLGLLPHGSMGYSTADRPPSCPVLPGTGVLQVCFASGTISVAVLGAELQAQGAEPTEVSVVQGQGHHSEVPQSCSTSCQSSNSGGWRVSHPARPQPGGHQPGHKEPLARVCPVHQGQVCFFKPSS